MKRTRTIGLAAVSVLTAALAPLAWAQATASAPANEVTLKGVMMYEVSCTRTLQGDDAKAAAKRPVLFVVEGTPEVAAVVEGIIKEHWPGETLDAEHAQKINAAFEERLKYYITPGELTERKENEVRYRNRAKAVTGVVTEKDGKRWITPTRIEPTRLKYPDKMLAPPKPLAAPAKAPLVLKVTDALSLKCLLLPAGSFLERVPFYFTYEYDGHQMRYDDDYPRLVTLTRPFYLAEIPVTQEMYEAVIGSNPSEQKGPQVPVTQAPAADIHRFCEILSKNNGRTVRLPTAAEREYAARTGSSAPPHNAHYLEQVNEAPDRKGLLPVKSRKPSAWGLYDMVGASWEITGSSLTFRRNDETDPHVPCKEQKKWAAHAALGRNAFSWVTSREGVSDGTGTGYGLTRFRVAVDATAEEIAAMEKAAKE